MILKRITFGVCEAVAKRTVMADRIETAVDFVLVANGKNVLELATGEIVCSPTNPRAQAEDAILLTDLKVSVWPQPETHKGAILGELLYVEPDSDEDGNWASWMGFSIGLPAEQFEELWTATIARTPPTGFAFGVARDAMNWGSDHWHLKWDNKNSARIDVLEVSWSFIMGTLS